MIFPSGSVSQCITITIINDEILEGDEEFFVTISTIDEDIIINNAVVSISITDSDSM